MPPSELITVIMFSFVVHATIRVNNINNVFFCTFFLQPITQQESKQSNKLILWTCACTHMHTHSVIHTISGTALRWYFRGELKRSATDALNLRGSVPKEQIRYWGRGGCWWRGEEAMYLIIIVKVFTKQNILSIGTILSTCMRTHTLTRKHRGTHTHEHTDYAKLALHTT